MFIDNVCISGYSQKVAGLRSGDKFPIGTSTQIYRVIDQEGNAAGYSFDVYVPVPTTVCQDATVQLDSTGNVTVEIADVDAGSTLNGCNLFVTPANFTCADIGDNTVSLSAYGGDSDTTFCTATVTVEDNVPPVPVCADHTIHLDANGDASIVAVDIDGGSSDSCSNVSISASPLVFGCSNVGSNNVTLTVTDTYLNSDSCIANVTVIDTVSPIAQCQEISIQLDAAGNGVVTTGAIDNGSTDACGILSRQLSNTAFTCSDIGPNNVTLMVLSLIHISEPTRP